MNKKTYCFVAGRSGGHIIPAITCAKQQENANILFFSADTPLDKQLTDHEPIISWNYHLHLDTMPLKKPWRLPLFFYKFFVCFCTAFSVLYTKKPSTVTSTGGYIALPVCCAAWIMRIPIELYELNATPGKASMVLAPLATKIYVCFEEAKQFFSEKKTKLTEYPIRYSQKKSNRRSSSKKTILLLGGSQGSVSLNTLFKKTIEQTPDFGKHFLVIHQTGTFDSTNWNDFYKHHSVEATVRPFFDHLDVWYDRADLVICRSGAGSLFETLFFQKPCITIPLETSDNNHQLFNALAIQKEHPDLFSVARQHDIKTIDINSASF